MSRFTYSYANVLRIDRQSFIIAFSTLANIGVYLSSPRFLFHIFVSPQRVSSYNAVLVWLLLWSSNIIGRPRDIQASCGDRVAGGGEGEGERETGHWQSGTLMPINYVLGTTCTLLPPSLQHLRLACWLVFIDIMLAYVVYISYRSIGTSRYILARLVSRMPPNCEHCPDR